MCTPPPFGERGAKRRRQNRYAEQTRTCSPIFPWQDSESAQEIPPGRGYIAATQWHPEFHKQGSDTLDDTAILNDFLAACVQAREHPVRQAKPVGLRDRATRLLRGALQRDRKVAAR